jgi:hypothetical protein
MNTRKHIEELFSGYQKTTELAEFMEEMESNLNDRIASLRRSGDVKYEPKGVGFPFWLWS